MMTERGVPWLEAGSVIGGWAKPSCSSSGLSAPSRWRPFTQDQIARSTTFFARKMREAIDSCAAFRIAGPLQKRILSESRGFNFDRGERGRKTKKQKNVLTLPCCHRRRQPEPNSQATPNNSLITNSFPCHLSDMSNFGGKRTGVQKSRNRKNPAEGRVRIVSV